MSDFKQNGPITTLHRLPGYSLEKIENDLRRFAKRSPMTLILPSLFSELEGPALANILEELKGADYMKERMRFMLISKMAEYESVKTQKKLIKKPMNY